jgi:phenylacetate-CoA ligase
MLEVSRPRHLDELAVRVEVKPEFAQAGEAAWSRAARELEHHIKSYVGVSTHVVLVGPGMVERSAGKAKRVIDLRGKPA